MKKLYAFALASLLAAGASAQSRMAPVDKPVVKAKNMRGVTMAARPHHDFNKPQRAAALPTSIDEYAGNYSWSYGPLMKGDNGDPVEITISVKDAAKGEVELIGIFDYAPIPATIDVATGKLTIENNIYLTEDSQGKLYFYLKDWNDAGYPIAGASKAAAAVGTYSDGVFTFDPYEVWAVGDPANEGLGYYVLSYQNKLESIKDVDPNEGWTSLGEATFQDGWILPAFNVDQTKPENHYKVELQQSNVDKNIYRLVDPYRGNFPFVQYNESTVSHGYIEFNVSDPDHVYFNPVDAGYADSELEITKLYCMNALTFYMGSQNVSKEEVVSTIGNTVEWTTFKDGVVTLPYYYDSEYGYVNDACFGIQGQIYGGFAWQDSNKNAVNMETKIFFPDENAVNEIEASKDAPVVYYNMQGMRITDPRPGTLYIRTQGGKATKIVK